MRETARNALAPAWVYTFGWTALVGVVATGALLVGVRAELGVVARDDLPRYLEFAGDLGVIPAFDEFQAQASYDLTLYRDRLDRVEVAEADLPQLLLAGDDEARSLMALRIEQGTLRASALAIGGGPWPFPPVPPLRIDGYAGMGRCSAPSAWPWRDAARRPRAR